MAGQKQGSARVTLREIDLSQVGSTQVLPQGVPAAVVGTAKKGPAFVPQTFANMQQFTETFGSMSSRGRLDNSNLLAPLAFNEWMRNSQAGTFLRVLGVGDGDADATGSGFVVGNQLVQPNASGDNKNKVYQNQHATITDSDGARTTASEVAKTHILGCFMKDVAGSTFLQDAGVQTAQAAGSLKIRLTNDEKPATNDTLKLTFLQSDDNFGNRTFTFTNGNTANDNIKNNSDHSVTILHDLGVAINANATTTKDNLTASLTPDTLDTPITDIASNDLVPGLEYEIIAPLTGTVANWQDAGASSNAVGTVFVATATSIGGGSAASGRVKTSQDQANATLTITSDHASKGVNTNNNEAQFNINPTIASNITVGDKTASVEDATFNYGMEGGSGAKCVVTILDIPEDGDVITLTSFNNNNQGTLTDATVAYYFTSTTITAGTDKEAGKWWKTGAGDVRIDASSSKTKVDVLSNIKSAIDNASSNHAGKFETSLSSDGLSLTIIQKQKGVAGRKKVDNSANIKLTNLQASGATSFSVFCADGADGVADVNITDHNDEGFFSGGADADSISFTMTLSGQPNDNDFLTLYMLDSNDDTTRVFENFVFESAANAGGRLNGDKTAGNSNQAIAFQGGTRNPSDNFVTVLIGDDLQETLYNLKNAIRSANNINAKDDLKAEVDDATDSIKITLFDVIGDNNSNHKSSNFLYSNVINVSDVATFSNPAGESLVGNYGEKKENFSGGGGAAAPVIRGILMAPQGVKPSMEVSSTVDGAYVRTNESGLALINEVAEREFGSTVNTNLAGYSIGDVDATSDSFKVILNGFNNTVNPEYKNVYTCSFDPKADNYFAKVLNTDPSKIEELGHYLYAHWDIEKTVAAPSRAGLLRGGSEVASYDNMIGFLASKAKGAPTDYEKFEGRYATAKTPWLVSQFYSSANNSDRPGVSKDKTYDLFRLHVLDDGECGNDLYRVLISDLRYEANDFGTFTLTLEKYDSDSINGTPVITWRQLSLDPDHRNFIGRVIGDKHMYYDFDQESGKQRLRQSGLYEVTNKYVRVELSTGIQEGDVPVDALPTGFKGHAYPLTTDAFSELGTGAQLVFSNSSNTKMDKLALAQVLPLPYVDSVSRKVVGTTLEAESELAWGVKFGIKKNVDLADPKELTENEFNKSLLSWAKFYPSAILRDGDNADSFQNSFFSLEKIQIPNSGISGTDISSWDNALYKRDGKFNSTDAGRFVTISSDAKGANVKFLKFRCMFQGGWDGVNIFDKEKAELSNVAAEREGRDETGASKITGPTVMAYRKAVDVLKDKSAAEFQLLVLPGQRSSSVTDYAIEACETRFDAMLVMDIEEYDLNKDSIAGEEALPHVTNTRNKFEDRSLNTSFAAAYFPNVIIRRTSDGAPLEVPPSVAMIGVMSRNDAIEAPWFAPAGLSRGTLINSIDSKVQMNRQLLDDLYDADINPIYVPAGRPGEVYAFGQKTLLQNQSALDRINVRRLLIDIRRKVRVVGEQLLFEPNRESTLQRFSSLVEPIMQDVQRRRGVVRYKVQIDTSTTTQNDIENNTIRGKIYLQPTKSVEFISLDFVVANTID